jgi:hypothetical protein
LRLRLTTGPNPAKPSSIITQVDGSGDSLFGEVTFANSDFTSLGLTLGTYVWSWGAGAHADTFTVQIGVPEPSTWALLLAGFGGLGLVGSRRTRKARAIG